MRPFLYILLSFSLSRLLSRSLPHSLSPLLHSLTTHSLSVLSSLLFLLCSLSQKSPNLPFWRWFLGGKATGFVVEGQTTKEFQRVSAAFRKNFEEGHELGSQFCVYHRGKKVVDLWGRKGDEVKGSNNRLYDGDSLQVSYSSTKVLTALSAAVAYERGCFDYNDKIVKYWPEFANGDERKKETTIADVLRHQAGLSNFNEKITREDFEKTNEENIEFNSHFSFSPSSSLSSSSPPLSPRPSISLSSPIAKKIENSQLYFADKRVYHGVTRGMIINELLKRVNHPTVGLTVYSSLAQPLGVHKLVGCGKEQGLEEGEKGREEQGRVVKITHTTHNRIVMLVLVGLLVKLSGGLLAKMGLGRALEIGEWKRVKDSEKKDSPLAMWMNVIDKKTISMDIDVNEEWWHNLESPSSNGLCCARGLGKIAGALANGGEVDGVRILSHNTIQKMQAFPQHAYDEGMHMHTYNTQGGVTLFSPTLKNEGEEEGESDWPRETWGFYGWGGYGGSIFVWNPSLEIGMSFTMTQLGVPFTSILGFKDPRCLRLVRAVRESLGGGGAKM